MAVQAWVATKDIDEPNLKLKAGQAVPQRFQVDHIMKQNVIPFFDEGTFKKIDVEETEQGTGRNADMGEVLEAIAESNKQHEAFAEMVVEALGRIEKLLSKDRPGT